ncbi:unnamed protein product [Mucor hiemalis]
MILPLSLVVLFKNSLLIFQTLFLKRILKITVHYYSNKNNYVGILYIKAAIHTLLSTGIPITITKICEQLTSCIVESYDNATSLFVYKTAWCSRISKVLNDKILNTAKLDLVGNISP